MSPAKVTAILASPLAGGAPYLDAVLEAVMSRHMPAIVRTSRGAHHAAAPRPVRGEPFFDAGKIPIPIARSMAGGVLVPRCSAPIVESGAEQRDHFASRFPTEIAAALAPSQRIQINTTGGRHKSIRLPIDTVAARRVVWFCVAVGGAKGSGKTRGALSEIRRRLAPATGIGKKIAMGYGRVSRWVVEPWEEDWSWFAPHPDGQVLMRALPAGNWLPENLHGARPWFGACRGPYWHPDNFMEIVVPC